MKIAVLFDGAGLARLGLEKAGHDCTGFEIDPWKIHLGQFVGNGVTVLGDVKDHSYEEFDAIWASPPCQLFSKATHYEPKSKFAGNLLHWSLALDSEILWVENVVPFGKPWGPVFNAGQFLKRPIQNRNRIIAGRYKTPYPYIYHQYKANFVGAMPTVLASEYKGSVSDQRRASRAINRKLTLDEVAYLQGFRIPPQWSRVPWNFPGSESDWIKNLYEAIGNGVPTYMSEAFGKMYA